MPSARRRHSEAPHPLVASVRLRLVASVLAHSARLRLLLPLVAYLPVRLRLVASVRLRVVPSAVRLPLVASVPVRLRLVALVRLHLVASVPVALVPADLSKLGAEMFVCSKFEVS